jgi:aryl-alcohol dehydrogenase-like predicted oxidoreductase
VTKEHIERARKIVPIVTVQNRYSFADREWDHVVDYCRDNDIGFMPWAPIGQNRFAHDALDKVARQLNASPLRVALAWLLKRSKVMLPIPGTSSVKHVEENIAAAGLDLPQQLFDELSAVSQPPRSLRG